MSGVLSRENIFLCSLHNLLYFIQIKLKCFDKQSLLGFIEPPYKAWRERGSNIVPNVKNMGRWAFQGSTLPIHYKFFKCNHFQL